MRHTPQYAFFCRFGEKLLPDAEATSVRHGWHGWHVFQAFSGGVAIQSRARKAVFDTVARLSVRIPCGRFCLSSASLPDPSRAWHPLWCPHR